MKERTRLFVAINNFIESGISAKSFLISAAIIAFMLCMLADLNSAFAKSNEKTDNKAKKENSQKKNSEKNIKKAPSKLKKDNKKESDTKGDKKAVKKNSKSKTGGKNNPKKTSEPPKSKTVASTDEVVIDSMRFKVGGITLENNSSIKKESKIKDIEKLVAEVKKDYNEIQKTKPKKKNKYCLKIPASYHDIDMKLAREIMRRVHLSSLSMFKTLYLPHLKKARRVKKAGLKSSSENAELDERTKMAFFIVGNFINEVIEKYNSGNLSRHHKDFQRWINEGANLVAFGTIFPADIGSDQAGGKKKKNKKGVITFTQAKKLLRALIEVESSAVQMSAGCVNISLNMRTYPRDGSYVIGFMQESVDDFSSGINLFDPEVNIKYTCKKLHKYLLRYGGNIDKMLRHYNAGPGNMDCDQAYRYSAKVHNFMQRY